MRPQTFLLATLSVLLAGGLLLVLLGTTGPEADGSMTVGMSPGAAASPEARAATPEAIPAGNLRTAGPLHRALAPPGGPLAAVESDASTSIDVIVLDRSGGALLGAAGSLPASERSWIRPVLGRGPALAYRADLPRQGLIELAPRRQRVSQRPGWFNSFERPAGEAFVALAFGDHVLVAAPIDPAAGEVVLSTDLRDVEGMYTRLEGRLPGMIAASTLVRVRPESQAGQPPGRSPQTLPARGAGTRFTVGPLPPGRMTVLVRAEASALGPALLAAKEARGLHGISLGATLPNAEQWDLRLGVLGQLRLPIADIEVTLAPGESRDLGTLSPPRAGAAILHMRGARGAPVDAAGVLVLVLGASGATAEPVLTWTFEAAACLYPLHPRATELMVVQGDLGALVSLFPAELSAKSRPTEVQVNLRPLGVVILPAPAADGPGPELWTAERRRVQNDPRWVGSHYLGHEIGGRVLAVPQGSYLAQTGGSTKPAAVNVQSGEAVEVGSDGP